MRTVPTAAKTRSAMSRDGALALALGSACLLGLAEVGLALQSRSKVAVAAPARPIALRTVIASGGPSREYNQYAIESNARYVEFLTARGRAQTILFADGSRVNRTISTLAKPPGYRELSVFGWLFDDDSPSDLVVPRATGLRRVDGPSQPQSILNAVRNLAAKIQPGERGLLYFTGHGSLAESTRLVGFHLKKVPDSDKALFSTWGDGDLGVGQLAPAVAGWPARVPLTVVMVQCHSGGFANLIFTNADPALPVLDRDICGFFSSIAEREAAGCTSEVDEINYQDFTTHFFAALSGKTRDGRLLPPHSADYDANGVVSGLEAFAWAQVNDRSIDVPVTTSDIYLRAIFSRDSAGPAEAWATTSYSHLLKVAAPWQRAQLEGLSKMVALGGENRVQIAARRWAEAESAGSQAESGQNNDVGDAKLSKADAALYWSVQARLAKKYPALAKSATAPAFRKAKPGALRMLRAMPAELTQLYRAQVAQWQDGDDAENRLAYLARFVRASRTLYLEERLASSGTAAQKAIFARLRNAETRNPLVDNAKPMVASAVN